jgi:hypothetical protein
MGDMLDNNIDIFLNKISEHFGINRIELEKFKDYKPYNTEFIEEIKTIYRDRQNKEYILLDNNQEPNSFYALQFVKN